MTFDIHGNVYGSNMNDSFGDSIGTNDSFNNHM